MKELAQFSPFLLPTPASRFLSFKIILNLLSTDAGSQAHPLELEVPLDSSPWLPHPLHP